MPDVSPQEQEVRPTVTLREALLQSCFAPGRTLPDSIKEIELRSFGDDARTLAAQTANDPQNKEFGKLVYVTNDKKVLINNTAAVGEIAKDNLYRVWQEIRTEILVEDMKLPWYIRQTRMLGMDMHSHPFDAPHSAPDLLSILLPDSDPSASAAAYVVTPNRHIVIFRGPKARWFSEKELTEKIKTWENAVKNRVQNFIVPGMTLDQKIEINSKARGALLRQLARQYNLKIFSGDIQENTVRLQSNASAN